MSDAIGNEGVTVSSLVTEIVLACKAYQHILARKLCEALRQTMRRSGKPPTDKEARDLLGALRSARIFDELALTGGLIVTLGGRGPRVRKLQAQGLIEGGQISAATDVVERLATDIFAEREQGREQGKTQAEIDGLTDEYADSIALLGRAAKQTFADLADPDAPNATPSQIRRDALLSAVAHYRRALTEARPSNRDFAGVNILALAVRAHREGIVLDPPVNVEALAEVVEAAVDVDPKRRRTDAWAMASLAEASLARAAVASDADAAKQHLEAAADWFGLYAYHPKVDAFALAGTIRQLEEIWGERIGKGGAGPILSVLKSRLLQLEGGAVSFTLDERAALSDVTAKGGPGDLSLRVIAGAGNYTDTIPTAAVAPSVAAPVALGAGVPPAAAAAPPPIEATPQRRISESSAYFDYMLMLKIVERCKAVARICDGPGNPVGTGFMVRGGDICPEMADDVFVVTNSHVVSRHGATVGGTMPLSPQRARVIFDAEVALGQETIYRCELLWESPARELDVAILRLTPAPPRFEPIPVAEDHLGLVPELAGMIEAATRLIVIGHPQGQSLKISMDTQQRSTLLDMGTKPPGPDTHIFLHYRTQTDPGSSGSPVLDEQSLKLVGLHRAGPAQVKGTIPRLNGVVGTHEANEGVFIGSIRGFLANCVTQTGPALARPSATQPIQTPGPARSPAAVRSEAAQPWQPLLSQNPPPGVGSGRAAQALQRIMYPELIARLSSPDFANADLAGYVKVVPNAGSAFNPVFCVDPALVDMGVATSDPAEAARLAGHLNAYCRIDRQLAYRRRVAADPSGPKLMAEGDSWFEYPMLIDDVIDHLGQDYPIYCLASSMDTHGSILSEANFRTEIEPALSEMRPDVFLLSVGGGLLVGDSLVRGLKDFAAGLQPRDYPTAEFTASLEAFGRDLRATYDRLLSSASVRKHTLRIMVHGYDLPAPLPGGSWLDAPLRRKGIEDPALQASIVSHLLDRLAGLHQSIVSRYPGKVLFVDCRKALGPSDWADELHPTSAGFAKVAARFTDAISRAMAPRPEARRIIVAPALHPSSRSNSVA